MSIYGNMRKKSYLGNYRKNHENLTMGELAFH